MAKNAAEKTGSPSLARRACIGKEEKRLLPEQILALSRVTSTKLINAVRGQMKAGQTYSVDFGVRVTGQVIIGHDADYTSNKAPAGGDLVQALLAQFGPRKRRAIVAKLVQSGLPAVIKQGGKADGEPVPGLAELAQELVDGLTTTAPASRRGNVTGDCEVRLVEWSV